MSRRETMQEDKFRVQWFKAGVVFSEELRDTHAGALELFHSGGRNGDRVELQKRPAGEPRFKTLLTAERSSAAR